ncbi:beta/alpha barrel domain-containing protein [Helicobacter suis]|uniref:indole-3-glycerol phosphate synthase n=1 Tax=Helicobacter suis TaxID=104628 RepID=UPI0002E34FCB|nr:indole-3-glycerol phosphate synthase [Helicobacter suis]
MSVEYLKQSLELRQTLRPFEMLGRSLAYNPHLPRLDLESLRRFEKPHKILTLNATHDLETLVQRVQEAQQSNYSALLLDFSQIYQSPPSLEMLDLLGYIRRLSSKPIIQKDLFMDRYQVLEALVYGADALLLEAQFLEKNLKQMVEYSTHLGLLVIVQVSSSKDLQRAVFARARALFLARDAENLLKLTPQNFVILKEASASEYGADALIF